MANRKGSSSQNNRNNASNLGNNASNLGNGFGLGLAADDAISVDESDKADNANNGSNARKNPNILYHPVRTRRMSGNEGDIVGGGQNSGQNGNTPGTRNNQPNNTQQTGNQHTTNQPKNTQQKNTQQNQQPNGPNAFKHPLPQGRSGKQNLRGQSGKSSPAPSRPRLPRSPGIASSRRSDVQTVQSRSAEQSQDLNENGQDSQSPTPSGYNGNGRVTRSRRVNGYGPGGNGNEDSEDGEEKSFEAIGHDYLKKKNHNGRGGGAGARGQNNVNNDPGAPVHQNYGPNGGPQGILNNIKQSSTGNSRGQSRGQSQEVSKRQSIVNNQHYNVRFENIRDDDQEGGDPKLMKILQRNKSSGAALNNPNGSNPNNIMLSSSHQATFQKAAKAGWDKAGWDNVDRGNRSKAPAGMPQFKRASALVSQLERDKMDANNPPSRESRRIQVRLRMRWVGCQ